jgi:hypothetical protein
MHGLLSNTHLTFSIFSETALILQMKLIHDVQCTVKVPLSGSSSIGKVALMAYFHRAHYNSPMALAAYFHRAHYNSPMALVAYFHRAHYNSPMALAAYFHRAHYNSPMALVAYFHRAHYNSPMALAAYFHRAHYNSPMALAAYFHRAHYNSPMALVAYFHRAHYNSPMALAAYFCRYPASRGISRAVPKVSESSTGGAARTDQLTLRPRLVFSRQPSWCVAGWTNFYCFSFVLRASMSNCLL